MKDIKRENDSYRGNENQSFNEFKRFEAEDFKNSELVKQAFEAYKSEEVKKISFVDAIKDKAKNKKEFKNKQNKTHDNLNAVKSNSVSTSMGSIGTTVITGVVGAAVVLGPVIGLSTDTNFGTFEVQNYVVEKSYDENNSILNDIYLYFNKDKINKDYYPRLKNPLSEKLSYIDLNNNKNSFLLEDLPENIYKLQIDIFKKGESTVIDSEEVTINTIGSSSFTVNTYEKDYLVTFNSDGTSNYYFSSNFEIDNEAEIVKETKIFDESMNVLDYQINEIDKFNEIKNIKENKYFVEEKFYRVEGIGKYQIYKSNFELIDLSSDKVTINATQSKALVKVDDISATDVEVVLTYNDNNDEKERIKISKSKQFEDLEIKFSQPSSDIDVEVRYKKKYSTFEGEIPFQYEGNPDKQISISKNFKFNVQSELKVKTIEFCSEIVSTYSDIVTIYLEGYLLPEEYAAIELVDYGGNIIFSQGYIKDLRKPIEIFAVPKDEEVTLRYMTYYEVTPNPDVDLTGTGTYPYDESLATNTTLDSIDVTFETNNYHELVTNGLISYTPVDPSQYYLTLNSNNKLNAYADLNFVNNSEENAYVKLDITEMFETAIYRSEITYDGKIEMNDFGDKTSYEHAYLSPTYSLFIEKNNVAYQLAEDQYTENSFSSITEGKYSLSDYLDYVQQEDLTSYLITLNEKVISDIEVEILVGDEVTETYTISNSDLVNQETGEFIVDLSSYSSGDYVYIKVNLEIELNSKVQDTSFINSFEIEGTTTVKAFGETSIYL